jgi:hypothetical protein
MYNLKRISSENTLILHLNEEIQAPENVVHFAAEKGLCPKSEFHITIIGS